MSATATRRGLEQFVIGAARDQQSRPHRIAPMLRAECWGLKPNPPIRADFDAPLTVIRCPLCASIMALDATDPE